MEITLGKINLVRAKTGASFNQVIKALKVSYGDVAYATAIIEGEKTAKKAAKNEKSSNNKETLDKSKFDKVKMGKLNMIIHTASAAAGTIGALGAQLPTADNAVIVPIQIGMVSSIGKVFGFDLTRSASVAILTTIATTMVGRAAAQAIIGWVPVIGNVVNATTAAAVTESAGWATVAYFENLQPKEEKNYKKSETEKEQEEKAAEMLKTAKLNENIRDVLEKINEYRERELIILAEYSIGTAAGMTDGMLTPLEHEKLNSIVFGYAGIEGLPKDLIDKIQKLIFNPPSFNDAMEYIKQVDRKYWYIFNNIIQAMLDEEPENLEKANDFKAAWEKYYDKGGSNVNVQ